MKGVERTWRTSKKPSSTLLSRNGKLLQAIKRNQTLETRGYLKEIERLRNAAESLLKPQEVEKVNDRNKDLR
jgi:hypothetical protein